MDKPLSYSAYKRYTTCPQYYKYNDIDKIKAGSDTTALAVGTIVDEVVMGMLRGTEVDHISLIHKFAKKKLDYYPDDLDVSLIQLKDLAALGSELGYNTEDISADLKKWIKAPPQITSVEGKLLHAAVWESLSVKIACMLDSFEKWILPEIKEVHDIQTKLDDGVTHGYLDFTATLQDGRRVLFDLKTSKMPYSKDAVLKSPQLSLYAAMKDYEYAGFIVLSKTLNKNRVKTCKTCGYRVTGGNGLNCPNGHGRMDMTQRPTSYSQMLVNKVPEWNKDLTKQAMADTIKAIKGGHFPRNLNTCFYIYGKQCPYVSKCWRTNE